MFRENIITPEKPHKSAELTTKQKEEGLVFGVKKLNNIKNSLDKYPQEILKEYGLDYIQERCDDLIELIKKDSTLFKDIDLQDKIGNFEPCSAMLDHIIKYPQKENMKQSLNKEVSNLNYHLEELLSLDKTIH